MRADRRGATQRVSLAGACRSRYHKCRMETFRQRIEFAARADGPFVPADALVDTGATYTLVPRSVVNRRLVKAEKYLA